ncbi:hypothetical protein C8T65DRAFT_651028, partial [Cerioporus squamosus]
MSIVVPGQSFIALSRFCSALGWMSVSGLRFESVVLNLSTATGVLRTALDAPCRGICTFAGWFGWSQNGRSHPPNNSCGSYLLSACGLALGVLCRVLRLCVDVCSLSLGI